ncbi:hypothetical protein BaRGS_00039536 [Batillaria attramentaria]|uniref:Palmitoyltransferase n=1 Tax=Batillaria attramentaria TaxID=370345 RepID=A0ABD0J372_9CAEN
MACERCVCKAKYFVRLAHTFLSVGVPVSLLFKNTLLTRSLLLGENLVFGVMYVLLLVFSLSMYFMACCTDPGFLHVKMKQPMRTKHCEDCGKCVRKYDHHCPWLEACIGERNHKFFWLFLLSTAALIPWTFYISWNGIVYNPLWGTWLRSNILLLIDILILVIGGFVVIGLLGFHTFLMLRGLTTWEAASRERITYLKYLDEDYNPFNEGLCKNMFYFLCSCRSRKWEGVYATHAHMDSSVA